MEHQANQVNLIISESWLDLQPMEYPAIPLKFSHYLEHIRKVFGYDHIPDEVLEQWIYPLHADPNMVRSYAWIDFLEVGFIKESWTVSELLNVRAIKVFMGMLEPIDDRLKIVEATGEDKRCWDLQGTWLVPPIILDTYTFTEVCPLYVELQMPFQLVEGHSRMRNLLISRYQQLPLAPMHQVYRMFNRKFKE